MLIFRNVVWLIFVIGYFAGYSQDDNGASTFFKSGTGSFCERLLGFSGPMVTEGGVAYKLLISIVKKMVGELWGQCF